MEEGREEKKAVQKRIKGTRRDGKGWNGDLFLYVGLG